MNDSPQTELPENVLNYFGEMWLYSPRGVKVKLPVPIAIKSENPYVAAMKAANAALDAGWLVNAPGLEAGENVEEIGFAVRKEKDDNGEITPVLDLYSVTQGMIHSFITIYLNSPADIQAFESASGLTLKHMPLYEGRDKIKRGENRKLDEKVKPFGKPSRIVWIPNPKYDPKEAEAAKAGGKMYTVPKKKFVRWADAPPASANSKPATSQASDAEAVNQQRVKEWQTSLSTGPSVEEVNAMLPALPGMNQATKRVCWEAVKHHADECGWVFDQTAKQFFQPEPSPEASDGQEVPF